ncbi:MAG TPA: sulfatase [Rhizomicrobium sp.]|jgi:arylsulfatase A-like enzyme|nr:sulfatase [Rhizomicrobium sp.]
MSMPRAKNAIVILLDSLNRHMVGAYGGRGFATPNLDRLATRSVRFTKHYAASLPCMPARHDILCGAWDFLWRPWGSVEIWEDAITYPLRRAGVVSQLISDHPHLFETGGENYHVDFTGWDYQRGHEGDPWKTKADPSWAGSHFFGFDRHMPYDNSRGYFRGEEDFPGPRVMQAATRWLKDNAGAHDRFFLFVDEFDPHEPFDTPEEYLRRYDPDWDGPMNYLWPPYAVGGVARGVLTAREGQHIRARYGAKLTMIDHWLGRVLDQIDAKNLWDDTMVVLCTDHGHYLGEKDIWGKPGVPLYETMSHIPLMIAAPGLKAGTNDALTTSVDIYATLSDLFGVTPRQQVHGKSLLPLLEGTRDSVRDWLLAGVWGREVHYIDKETKYARAPAGKNAPNSMWSNRWSTMPTHFLPREQELPLPDERAVLDRMPGSNVPVIRQHWDESDPLPFWAAARFSGNHLYDLNNDPSEEENLANSGREADAAEKLRTALKAVEAPDEQFVRLGLK